MNIIIVSIITVCLDRVLLRLAGAWGVKTVWCGLARNHNPRRSEDTELRVSHILVSH